jgi:hypothetical protein
LLLDNLTMIPLTRERQWQITGGLFLLSPVVFGFGLQSSAPEWAHGIGLLMLIYLVCFVIVAPIVWLAYDPPHIGPNTERCGGEN